MTLWFLLTSAALSTAQPGTALPCPEGSSPPFATDGEAETYLRNFVGAIFGPDDEKAAEEYFAPGYIAVLNGKRMTLAEEQAHFASVRASAKDIDYRFGRVIATCDGLAEQHSVVLKKLDDSVITLHAMSMIKVANGRITLIEEVAGQSE